MNDRPLILLATRSAGKLRELRPFFSERGLRVIDLAEAGIAESAAEDAIESFETFEENAGAKAAHFHALSGLPAVADDSGLEVATLGGKPGVRSKRWSERPDLSGQALDDANNLKLVSSVRGTTDRRARYVCVAAFDDGVRRVVRRGVVDGRIVDEPRGTDGFGYDPYFESVELGRTFGEVGRAEKELVSHRGRAFRALLDALALDFDARGGVAPG